MSDRFKALVDIHWEDTRVQAGELTDGVPARSVKWMVDQGLIERVKDTPAAPKRRYESGKDGE